MSNTASLSGTDTGRLAAAPDFVGFARFLIAAAVFSTLLVTVTPFAVTFEGSMDSGDLANQLGYSSLAAIVLAGHLVFSDRHVLAALMRPAWMLMTVWLLASAMWAANPENAVRSALFTLLAMTAVTGVFAFPRDARAFRWVIVVAASFAAMAPLPTAWGYTPSVSSEISAKSSRAMISRSASVYMSTVSWLALPGR